MRYKIAIHILLFIIIASLLSCIQRYDPESDFRGEPIDGGKAIKITDYVGNKQTVRIPTRLHKLPVTEIGNRAFEGKQIISVSIPNSVKIIGDRAFSDNLLTELKIPRNVTSIGERAFAGNQLTENRVSLPKKLTNIGNFAFDFSLDHQTIAQIRATENELIEIEEYIREKTTLENQIRALENAHIETNREAAPKNSWSIVIEKLAESTNRTPMLWIDRITTNGSRFIITGKTIQRDKVADIDGLFNDSRIVKMSETQIAGHTLWEFEISYARPRAELIEIPWHTRPDLITYENYLSHIREQGLFIDANNSANEHTTSSIKSSQNMSDLDKIRNTLQEQLRGYEGVQKDTYYLTYLLARKDFLENWIRENGKFYLLNENEESSEVYFQNIRRRFVPNFRFDFFPRIVNNQQVYTLSGSSRIIDLYIFINHIEKLGALYTIENLTLNPQFQESDEGPINLVNFSMDVKPHSRANGTDFLNTPFRRVSYLPLRKDPFRPAIYEPMTDPTQERLIKHEDLRLVSFFDNEAFFVDSENNLITLTRNQRVAYGYFSHINNESQAVFMINRTGLYELVTLNNK